MKCVSKLSETRKKGGAHISLSADPMDQEYMHRNLIPSAFIDLYPSYMGLYRVCTKTELCLPCTEIQKKPGHKK